jgi:MSHA biogenesis protein MshJ
MKRPEVKFPSAALEAINRLNGLSQRERLLITITCLALIVSVWYLLFIEPLAREATDSRQRLSELQERLLTANDTLEEQVWRLTGDGAEQQRQIAALTQQLEQVNQALGDYNSELIEPGEMARILEGILIRQSALDLVHVQNLPAEALQVSDEEGAPVFYRHGLEIEVEGSYAEALDYLLAVEALPWRLYWQVLDIEVLEFPRNRIRIEVSTLSLDEEWIGA